MISQTEVIDVLKDIFGNVNIWLHFAEAKNGAIIGVNGLFLCKAIDIMIDMINGEMAGCVVLVASISVIFLTALIISVVSFMPDTSALSDDVTAVECDTVLKKDKVLKVDERILIFYEHIKLYKSSQNYLMDIYKHYFEGTNRQESLSKQELDYAKEILINSRITSRKYRLFNTALRVNMLGIILTALLVIVA